MNTKPFAQPQQQSVAGVILIFFQLAYKFMKGFWGVFILVFFTDPSPQFQTYLLIALGVLLVAGLIYSYVYYQRFRFYIDYDEAKFILEKGVFSTDSIRIPFDKIQQVDLKRSLLQRLIGVYGMTVDTAGSKGDEIEIKAISGHKAKTLSAILTKVQTEKATSANTTADAENPTQTGENTAREKQVLWTHRLSFLTLCKIGLTRSYLRGFVLITAAVFWLYSQAQTSFQAYLKEIEQYSATYVERSLHDFVVVIALVIVIFILSVLVTIGEVVFKHFDLKLQQTPTRLDVEMGMKTNTKVSFQARRLQRLKISTNPVQRRLNLYEAQFSLAGSRDKLSKSKIVVPGLQDKVVARIKSFLYGHASSGATRSYQPHIVWFYRRLNFVMLPLMVAWLVDAVAFQAKDWQFLLYASLIYLAVLVPYLWFLYKTVRLNISTRFLTVSRGLWTHDELIVELYKMEGVTVKQPLWYRRRNLYNLTFHTAGGDVNIRAIPGDFLKEINLVLYKIETVQKAWM